MKILALAGDGIGPEITAVTVQALERLDKLFALDLRFETHDLGGPLGTRAFGKAVLEKLT